MQLRWLDRESHIGTVRNERNERTKYELILGNGRCFKWRRFDVFGNLNAQVSQMRFYAAMEKMFSCVRWQSITL